MNCVSPLKRSAVAFGSRRAVIAGRQQVSFAQLWRRSAAVAAAMNALDIKPGTRIALVLDNSVEYIIAAYASWAAGCVVVPLNTAARAKDLRNWIEHSGAELVFYTSSSREAAALAGEGVATPMIATDSQQWHQMMESEAAEVVDREADELAAIIYTSGTTGTPKGVMLSHKNLLDNSHSIISYLHLDANDSTLCVLPFYYSYGNSILHTHLAAGATLVLENQFLYPKKVMARISEHAITGFYGVPSTYALLLSRTDLNSLSLKSLRYMAQAGGPMPVAHQQQIRQAVPRTALFIMYGQTEATARLTYLPAGRLEEKQGSAGVAIPGVQLTILDDNGNHVPPGITGEVCAQGDNIMLGYWRDGETTQKVLRDGWLHTGDQGRLDSDGFLFLTGRRTDFIKTGGHRVSPLEIEEVISELDGVVEAAVVGVPDEVLGEVIRAVIVTKLAGQPSIMQVKRHCRENLAMYKIPRTVEFTESLPRTASGKLIRRSL